MPIDFEQGWDVIQNGITKLKRSIADHGRPLTSGENMLLFTAVYNMCTQGQFDHSEKLYNKYIEILNEYIATTAMPSITTESDQRMLSELVNRWSNFNLMVKNLRSIFLYLDRHFVVIRKLPGLLDAGFICFRDLVYMEERANAREAVIALINKEREGEQVERSLLKNVVDVFVKVGLGQMDAYEQDFEIQMLDDTANYYRSKAANWIEVDSCPEYMLKAEKCLRRERDIVSLYLHSSTRKKLIENLQHELLVVHVNQLLAKKHPGCRVLLSDNKVEDLSRMYRLYHIIPEGLKLIYKIFTKHIRAVGTALVKRAEAAANNQAASGYGFQEHVLVGKFIALHDKYTAYVNNCFMNRSMFHKGLKEAFEVILNRTIASCSSAEVLASFCDNILKNGASGNLSNEAIEQILDKVVKLLAYCRGKDVFAEFYRKKLAHRLTFLENYNEDQEKSMLARLRQQNGSQFTSRMDRMVMDLIQAKDDQIHFGEYLRKNEHLNLGIDLTVNVLTTSFWPNYKSSDLNLPSEMVKCMEVFKGYYETRTKLRKLTWIYSLGTCSVNGNFESKTIELILSIYQVAALMLFNTADKLSFSEVLTQLNLNHEDLVRLLSSLSCGKYKILKKEPDTATISPNDRFEFNAKFTDRMNRIKIPLPLAYERRMVADEVNMDRRYAIDAVIVRVMKKTKVMTFKQLIMECVKQLGHIFKPDIKEIKKRVEDLIVRDYLERDRVNPDIFKYLKE